MKCPNCGETLKGKFNFCGFCGYQLKLTEKPAATNILNKPISELFKGSKNDAPEEKEISAVAKVFKENKSSSAMDEIKTDKVQDKITEVKPTVTNDAKAAEKPIKPEVKPIKEAPGTEAVAQPIKENKPVEKEEISEKIKKADDDIEEVKIPMADDDIDNENTQPSQIKVIDVIGQNKVTAKSMLTYLGLNVVAETQNSDSVPYGDVMSQSLEPGVTVKTGETIKLIVSVGTWTVWTEEMLPADKLEKFEMEEKKEYHYRTRSRAVDYKESTDKNAYPDYELYDSKNVFTDWTDEEYFTSDFKEISETCEISSTHTGFKYCGWVYAGEEANITEAFASSALAVYFNNSTSDSDWKFIETINKIDADATYVKWHNSEDNGTLTPAGDVVIANISIAGYEVGGLKYALKFGTKDTEWRKYKTRSIKEVIYYFKKDVFTEWGEWSEWVEKPVENNELTDTDTRTLYRFRRKATIKK